MWAMKNTAHTGNRAPRGAHISNLTARSFYLRALVCLDRATIAIRWDIPIERDFYLDRATMLITWFERENI